MENVTYRHKKSTEDEELVSQNSVWDDIGNEKKKTFVKKLPTPNP